MKTDNKQQENSEHYSEKANNKQSNSKDNYEPTTPRNKEQQLVEMIPIEDTPFTAVKADNKWFLTMGKYRLTQPLENLDACKEEANNTTWNRIMTIIQIMIEENEKKDRSMQKNGSTHTTDKKSHDTKIVD